VTTLHRYRHLFLLPAFLWVLAFTLVPFLSTLGLSFTNEGAFAGLAQYRRLVGYEGRDNWHAFRITLLFVVAMVAVEVGLGLALALFATRSFRGRGALRGLLMVPFFVSPLAIGYLGRTIFYGEVGGPVNDALAALGLARVNWLSDVTPAGIAIILVDVWQWTPFCFLILLAGLTGIPPEILEAAQLDCPSSFSLFRFILLPSLRPALATAFFLRLVEAFKIFDLPWGLTGGGPFYATETYTMLVNRVAPRRPRADCAKVHPAGVDAGGGEGVKREGFVISDDFWYNMTSDE
jgi:multiple sugar transport system permease protein